jgi:phthalate 4,5-cis-dihydrodiol dehydrogenase
MNTAPIRIGVIGLGRAFTLMLPTFQADPRVRLVAAFDPRAEARAQFVRDFAGRRHESAQGLCADSEVELVYVASPHQHHAAHVALAAHHARHVLLEKPMAINLDDCNAMIEQMQQAGRCLIVGHSHSFDAPVLRARAIIESGAVGAVRMVQAINYTDFLYRARRPEELHTDAGGGVIHSQAAHQVDVVRLLAGGLARSVRAFTGRWDAARPTEGAYSALIEFEGGAFASLTYSGYAHYDSDEQMSWIGEQGQARSASEYGAARARLQALRSAEAETQMKFARSYGGASFAPAANPVAHPHFGPVIVSCDRADLRLVADGVWIYGDDERRFDALPAPAISRQELVNELWSALREAAHPQHDGAWARATTELCLGMLASARERREISLQFQVPWQR